MDVFSSSSTPAAQRPSVEFTMPQKLGGKNCKASVRRLTAAGAEVQEGITFAGRTISPDGAIVGRETKERIIDGVVNVKASEVVMIMLD
jgi:hypothetical protein